jgi:AAA15 family ATPase/GTPase
MLIQFTANNYLSFKEEIKFSLVASSLKDKKVGDDLVIFNPIQNNKLRLLKSAVIYGANASGKSNFISAIRFYRSFISNSSRATQVDDKIDVENYKLNSECDNEPSVFEAIFLIYGKQYRYGFAVTEDKIESEWLYLKEIKPKAKEIELFFREENTFPNVHDKFAIAKDLVNKQMVRPNALLLSVAAQFNDPIAAEIFHWIGNFNSISGLKEDGYKSYTVSKLNHPIDGQRIINFTKFADLGIDDLKVIQGNISEVNPSENSPEVLNNEVKKAFIGKPVNSLVSFHQKFDKDLKETELVMFPFYKNESMGTQKYFSLAGPILDTLDNGKILVIDELDSKLHPLLTEKIISLFNSKETNPKNAQLIFTSHDTNLLSSQLFRRDQIWFTHKNRYGATTMYSLAEYKEAVRNDASFEKNYLEGKYGAVPSFKNFKKIFTQKNNSNNG